jgi:excisionase family DNA binding protein
MAEYLTVQELSLYLKRSPGAIRNLVLRRAVPYRKPASRLLFIKEEVDNWIKQSEGISIEELTKTE